MESLHWTESGSGWSSDRYRIERATSELFALVGTTGRESLIQLSPSTSWLKHVARRRERRRLQRAALTRHLLHIVIALVAFQASMELVPILAFPTALYMTVAGLRAVVWWMDVVHGAPWTRIRETYQ